MTIIYLGQPLLVGSSSLPESHNATDRHCFLFSLAPDGVYLAANVTTDAGELLPHHFTLTPARQGAPRRFTFCCTCPDLAIGRRYRPSCPAEPGLSSRANSKIRTSDRLTNFARLWYFGSCHNSTPHPTKPATIALLFSALSSK